MIDPTFPELKLHRLAMVQLVLTIFDLPDVKFQLKWLLLSRDRRDYEKKAVALLRRLTRKLECLELPSPIYNDVLFALHSMIQRTILYLKPIAWNLYKVTQVNSPLPVSPPGQLEPLITPPNLEIQIEDLIICLQWNQYGTIDTRRTFRKLHRLKKLPHTPIIYLEVFNLCLEDVIKDIWANAPTEPLEEFKKTLADDLSIQKSEIIATYFAYRFMGRSEELYFIIDRLIEMKVYPRSDKLLRQPTAEESMFRFAVYNGNYSAMRFFWDKLSEEERQRNLLRMLEAALMSAGTRNGWIAPLRIQEHEEYSEIAIFLMRHMSRKDFQELFYFGKKRDMLMIFGAYVAFPWQDSFISAVGANFRHFDAEVFNFMAAGTLYKAWKHAEAFGIENSQNKYFCFFRRIWGKGTLEMKKSYDVNYWRIFYLLGKLEENEMIKEIYRDESLRGRTRGALDEGERWFRVFYRRGTLAFWRWFEDEVLQTDGERRRFRSSVCTVLLEREKDDLWQEYKAYGTKEQQHEQEEKKKAKKKKEETKNKKKLST